MLKHARHAGLNLLSWIIHYVCGKMYYVYTAAILRTISERSRAVCSTVVYGESTVLDNSSFGQIDMAASLHKERVDIIK